MQSTRRAVPANGSCPLSARQAEIVDLILREAVHRAEEFNLRKAVNLGRLRKYGLVAAGLVGVYLAAGLLMPNFGTRLVAPWRLTPEEEAARKMVALKAEPIAFSLSRGDTEILRGSAFELEAALSANRPIRSSSISARSRARGAIPRTSKNLGY